MKSESDHGVVLLTTFDAKTRIIAHQEVHVGIVVRQAEALDVPLVGVPVHRGANEPYVSRVKRGIDLAAEKFGGTVSLAFGDLHLSYIRSWRDDVLGKELGMELEYPLWKVPYPDLMDDLEASGVRCVVTASSCDEVKVGEVFSRELCDRVRRSGIDSFGEDGDFHTVAEVWDVIRDRALGLT
ncbi:hypothetical protein ACHAWF_008128 [Thalassiosira exigua]